MDDSLKRINKISAEGKEPPVAQRPLNTHFVLLPQMRLVAFHLEQKQKSFSRFLFIFVGAPRRILVPKKK